MQTYGLTLNLGSGKDRREDCVNADIRADVGADWVVDICKPLDTDMRFAKIIANDVLEHLPSCRRTCQTDSSWL